MNDMKLQVILGLSVLIFVSAQADAQQSAVSTSHSPVSAQASPTVRPEPVMPDLPLALKMQAKPIITEIIPAAETKIKEATGAAITFDVEWKSVAKEEGLTRLGGQIKAVSGGIETLATDPDGKKALAARIKSIQINGTGLDQTGEYRTHWSLFLKGNVLVLSVSIGDQTVTPEEIAAALVKLL